jgi:hypothetical protein
MFLPDIKNWQPTDKDAKNVEDTKMLSTMARESTDMNESNDVGKEDIVSHPNFGKLGMNDRA